MSNFEDALAFTLKMEGGFSNHPSDPGGATNFGITQKTYNSFRVFYGLPFRSVKNITDEEVKKIYKLYYWEPINGDSLDKLRAIAIFDFAVNSGPRRALKYWEKSKDLGDYLDKRIQFYKRLNKPMFIKGWLNRVSELRKYLDKLRGEK